MLTLEILAIVLLTLLNGLLAMSELAVVSSRKSRLEVLANQGNHGARAALRLIDNPSRFLSTVQIGITLVGIVSGVYSGATLGQRLGGWFDTFAFISPHGNAIGIGVTVIVITYSSLLLGELAPKRIALAQPERIATLVAGPMSWLSIIAAPAVWTLHVSTETLLQSLGFTNTRETTVTEDEVKSLIAEGTQAGIFVPQEKEMLEGVLRLSDRSVRVIMTPRNKIVWLDAKSDRDTLIAMVAPKLFSRLLVCDGSIDHPIGIIQTKSLLPVALGCQEFSLAQLMTSLLCVTENTTVLKLLNRFKKEKAHFAVVVDEYGTTEGIVTLTDVIEAIAGDLPERGEDSGPQIVQRADGSWLADGTTPTDELATVTGIDTGKNAEMLAGFILNHLGRIPKSGDSFIHENARFEVVDMDGNRIDKVLIYDLSTRAEIPL